MRAIELGMRGMKQIGFLLVATALVLSACGQRTSDDTGSASTATGFDGQGRPINAQGELVDPALGAAIGQQFTVRVLTDQAALPAGGAETALIKVVVTDADNLPVADMPIAFSSTGGRFTAVGEATDANGLATAELSLEFDAANQDIQVTAVAGNFSGTARVIAEGSTLGLSGDSTVAPGNDVTIIATLTAGDGSTPIANEDVLISSLVGNTLSRTIGVTDPLGKVSVLVGSANGGDTISFSALPNALGINTVVEQHTFLVSDDQLQFADNSATEVPVNFGQEFSVNWSFNGTPIVNEELVFSITAGRIATQSTVLTDSNGDAAVQVFSATAGTVTLFVESADKSAINKHEFDFVGDTPSNIGLAITSSRVNARESATLVANVTDANGNPVKNTEILFSSSNLKGGQLSSTTAETNLDGDAQITFTAGDTATELNEVNVIAEVAGTSLNKEIFLTVVQPALNITLGSSNLAALVGEGTQYSVTYVVQVADGGGQAISDASVELSIEPLSYWKGQLERVDESGVSLRHSTDPENWKADRWANYERANFNQELILGPNATDEENEALLLRLDALGTTIECVSEDINKNRILDAGEDINNNGALDPQDPALLAAIENEELATIGGNGTLITDASGSGFFRVIYPVTNSGWSEVKVIARAQALGVEATDSFNMSLSPLASETQASNSNPVNFRSPYGTALVVEEVLADGVTRKFSSGCASDD